MTDGEFCMCYTPHSDGCLTVILVDLKVADYKFFFPIWSHMYKQARHFGCACFPSHIEACLWQDSLCYIATCIFRKLATVIDYIHYLPLTSCLSLLDRALSLLFTDKSKHHLDFVL